MFVFGGRGAPTRPCTDYGVFRVNAECLNKNGTFSHDSDNESFHWSWKADLAENLPCDTEGAETDFPCPRWRHSATAVDIKGKAFRGCFFKSRVGRNVVIPGTKEALVIPPGAFRIPNI